MIMDNLVSHAFRIMATSSAVVAIATVLRAVLLTTMITLLAVLVIVKPSTAQLLQPINHGFFESSRMLPSKLSMYIPVIRIEEC